MKKNKIISYSNIITALIGVLFLFSISVTITLNIRQIYYYEIRSQQLPEVTGLSEETIRENYNVLIDYNLLWKQKQKLIFPDFPMSEHGRIHFAEVKNIFIMIQIAGIISGIFLFVISLYKFRRKEYGYLRLLPVLAIGIPLIIGMLAMFNWETFFIRFHQLVFRNDYWLFDPMTDPIILILPDSFFLHCLYMIVGIILLGCMTSEMWYRVLSRRLVNSNRW